MVPSQRECNGECETRALSRAQVATILQQAIHELEAQEVADATVAVVDRVGNVLAVLDVGGGGQGVTIGSNPNGLDFPGNGLEGFSGRVPRELARDAAISKAGTAAYLSTQGAALSTRTLSQVIQEAFDPGEPFQPSGPLFGVQLSQLPCSDFVRRSSVRRPLQGRAGPKALPLGMSGDAGGAPLYIEGDPVGGIGVEIDGIYAVDRSTADEEVDLEETVAFAAQRSFQPNPERRAENVTVQGKRLLYRNAAPFRSRPEPALLSGDPVGGTLVDVPGTFRAADGIRPGARLFANGSGYALVQDYFGVGPVRVPVTGLELRPYLGMTRIDPALVPNATQREADVSNPRSSISPPDSRGGLRQHEVGTLVARTLEVAQRTRSQLHRITGDARRVPGAEVSVAVVDLSGNILGLAESRDVGTFAADVAIQKARTAAFFSRGAVPADPAIPSAPADDLLPDDGLGVDLGLAAPVQSKPLGVYVTDARDFLGDPTLFANGIAFSTRAIGALARPFFPDGLDGNPAGPLSQPSTTFSPFNTGLQLDLVIERLLAGILVDDATQDRLTCTDRLQLELRGGMQIQGGGLPVFKNGVVVGGIGVAGDLPDQEDLVAFEGLRQAGIALGGAGIGGVGHVGNAPVGVRASTLSTFVLRGGSVSLPYVSCPPSPFVDGSVSPVCQD